VVVVVASEIGTLVVVGEAFVVDKVVVAAESHIAADKCVYLCLPKVLEHITVGCHGVECWQTPALDTVLHPCELGNRVLTLDDCLPVRSTRNEDERDQLFASPVVQGCALPAEGATFVLPSSMIVVYPGEGGAGSH